MNRGVLDQIPRSSLALLLVAQAAVIAPHVPRLSIWIIIAWLACVVWRVLVYLGRWNYPPTSVKAVLVVLAGVGVAVGYGQLYGLDPTAALLIVAFSLKLLEMRERRDALVLIYLAYFVIGVQFLYEQAMAAAAYQLLATGLVTAALVGLNQSWSRPRWRDSLVTSGILLLQAVPLTVVIFFFFPRVAPLWSVPLPDAAARTGISDSMSPGDVAELGRSEELAFRVEFEGEIPPPSRLYWRALTMDTYDDGTWSTPRRRPRSSEKLVAWAGLERTTERWLRAIEPTTEALRYSVIIEPTYRPWLFALDMADPITDRIGIGRDYRLVAAEPVTSRQRYEVRTYPDTVLDLELPDYLRRANLTLPPDGNLQTRAFVLDLQRQGYAGAALAEQVLRFFRGEPFFYTLSPPTLDGDRIDRFLFETRRGFCAHYAGAFVFMMRQAGIPARVVAGYQGGELNPLATHLIVRQYDAHAWAEIWLEGRGWVRVDPTAAVAPERIERGAEAALGDEAGAEGSPFLSSGLRSLEWVVDALYFMDSLEFRWNVLVLSYDATQQEAVLGDLLGEVTPTRIAIAVAIAGGGAIALASIGTLLGAWRGRRPPLLRAHDRVSGMFAAAGLPRAPSETAGAHARRVAARWPELAEDALAIGAALDRALFDPDCASTLEPEMQQRLRRLQLQLLRARLSAGIGAAPAS